MPLEQLAPVGARSRLGIDRAYHRLPQYDAAPRRAVLEQLHDNVRFRHAALRREPAGRFRHEPAQRNRHNGGNQADDEHRLPAVNRYQKIADHAGECQPDQEQHLVEKEEAAALLRTDELADVGTCHRHLTARTDALDEAEHHHRRAAPGEQAGDIHRHEQHDGDEEDLQTPVLFGQRPEDHGAEQLTDVACREDQANLGRR